MAARRILLATTNPAKAERLRWLLAGLDVEPLSPLEAGLQIDVAETGRAHLTNARRKAAAWSHAFGGLALASDGGLVIPALGSRWDSIRTARFTGPSATDRRRVEALLEPMRPLRGEKRRAYWVEALSLGDNGAVVRSWQRRSRPGEIARSFRDDDLVPGFWAFSVWEFPHLGKRYAELTPDELALVEDHWTRLRPAVRRWLGRWWYGGGNAAARVGQSGIMAVTG